jgi:hypothetical protein
VEGINSTGPHGVGGWLLLLSRLLVVWSPINVGLSAASALGALPIRGWPLGILLALRLLVAGLGLSAGLAIGSLRPSAVRLAQAALVLAALMDVVVHTTPYYPSNLMPGEAPLYVGASIAYHGGWLAYLRWSKRVRNTFGPQGATPARV